MAKKRTVVKGLNVDATNLSGISTKAVASPVDTYVPPAQEKTTLSPLSQFVNAITPAVQAAADKRLEEKLKRERRIENFNFNKKQNQVKTEALVTHSQMVNSYKRNPEVYVNTPDETIIADIDKHTFNYVEKLRDNGVDELHIETYKADMEERKIKFLSDITDAKKSNVITQENIKMRDSFIALDTLNKENPIKAIELAKDLVDTHAKSFPTIDGKPDYKRINKILLGLADDVKESNPNNIYLAVLEELKQLDTSENLDKGSELRAKRDTFIAKANKGAAVQLRVQEAINKGTRVNTLGITASKDDLSLGLLRSTVNVNGTEVPFTKLNPKQQADQYRITGILPEVITNVVKSTIDRIRGGAPNTEESNEALRLGFQQYQILKAAGIPTGSYLTPEEEKLMEGLDLLIVREAKQPQFIAEKPLSEEDYTTEVDYNQANYVSAASILQGYDKNNEPEMTTALTKKVTADLKSFFGTAIDDLPTSSLIFKEAIEDFRYFRALGNDEKTSIKKAIAIVNKNYPIIESAGNKNFKYGFPHLHQNVPMGLKPEEVIPKINKSLANNPALQKHILATQGLEAGTYDISLVPNPINPVEVGIRVTDADGNFTNILGMFDKVKILSDPKTLYNMVAKDLARAEAEPLENSVESLISFDSDERRERTPTKIGEGEIAKSILNAPKTVKNILNSVGDAIVESSESDKDFITEVENSPKIGDREVEFIKQLPSEIIKFLRSDSGSALLNILNPIKPAGASTLDETQVGEFIPSNQQTGETVTMEGNTIEDKTANMIATQEGFSSTPYKDGKDRSVGYGFYLPALEADEKALIKDVNNVTKEEGAAVLSLKVQKIGNYLDQEIQGFRNIPEKAQSAIISMGYQLGVTNIPKTWKKFTAAIKEAGQYAQGSVEQAQALAKAKFEMLYNVAEDGTISLNKWATQTKKRAFEMAEAVGEETKEFANETSSTIMDYIFPKAEASTLTKGDTFKISEKPSTDTVVSIAKDKNPAETAVNLLGISEGSSVGREAIYGMWKNIVGDAKQKGQSLENFVANNSWCALFVTQVLRDSGVNTSKFIKTRDKYDFARIKTYQTAGKSVYNGLAPEGKPRGNFADAQAGDVLVKEHSPEESKRIGSKGHAGIVVKVEGSKVYFIAGNQNDQVQLSSYDINELPNAITIRRFTSDDNVPSKELPSFLDMKAQASATKFKNFMTSAYNWVTNK